MDINNEEWSKKIARLCIVATIAFVIVIALIVITYPSQGYGDLWTSILLMNIGVICSGNFFQNRINQNWHKEQVKKQEEGLKQLTELVKKILEK